MIKEFVFSGFGGQGVLTAGTLLANTGAINNLEVSSLSDPSSSCLLAFYTAFVP